VAELVGRKHLQNAIALNSTLFNAARVVGPAIGGVIISAVGLGEAFLLNAVSFIPMLVALALMRPREYYSTPKSPRDNVFRQLAEGLRYAINTEEVLLMLIAVAVLGTFGYNFSTILPLLAKYVLNAGALGLGMLTSAVGVGSLIAALGVASARRTSRAVILKAGALFSIVLMLVGISTWLPLTLGLLVILGGAGIVFSSSANTRLQLSVPNELRGRIMSLYFLLFAGTTPIGGILVGVLAAHFGVRPTVVLFGLLCGLGIGGTAVFARRLDAKEKPDATLQQSGANTSSTSPIVR
jgi:predicted MFS family arabinose efflux permease